MSVIVDSQHMDKKVIPDNDRFFILLILRLPADSEE